MTIQDKKLQEFMQNCENQRKVILDYQLKNESLSLHIHEENQQRNETLQKIASTREMCKALRKYFDTLKEKFEYCCEAKDAVDTSNNEILKKTENLGKKFEDLHFKSAEDIAYLKSALTAESGKVFDLKEEMNRNCAEVQEKLEHSKETLQLVQLEKNKILKDLEEEQIRCTQLQLEKNELLEKMTHIASAYDESMKQQRENEFQLKELLNSKIEIENNYSLACNKGNELKLKCSEMERAIADLTSLSEQNSTELKQSITNLEVSLNNEKIKVKTEMDKCQALVNKIDELELEKSSMEESTSRALDALEKQHKINVEDLEVKLNTMMEEKNAVCHELLEAKKQIFEHENSIAMLKTQSLEGDSTICNLKGQISILEKQLQEIDSEKEVLVQQKEELKNQILQSQNLNNDLKLENEELCKKIADKETDFAKKIEEIEAEVNVKLCKEDKAIDNIYSEHCIPEICEAMCLKADYDDLLKCIAEKDKDILDLRTECDSFKEDLNRKDLCIANLKADHDDLIEKLRQDLEKCKVCQQCETFQIKCATLEEEVIEQRNKLDMLEFEGKQKSDSLKDYEIKENKFRKCMQDLIKMLNETQENNSKLLCEKAEENLKLKDKISILEDKLNFGDKKIYEFNCLKEKVSEFDILVNDMKKEQITERQKLQLENKNLRKSLKKLESNKNIAKTTSSERLLPIPVMKKTALSSAIQERQKQGYVERDSSDSDYIDIEIAKISSSERLLSNHVIKKPALSSAIQERKKQGYVEKDSSESDYIDIEVLKGNIQTDPVVERRAKAPLMTSTPKKLLSDKNKRNLPDILETQSKSHESSTNAFFFQPKKRCLDKMNSVPPKTIPDVPGRKKFFKTKTPGKEANKTFSWF